MKNLIMKKNNIHQKLGQSLFEIVLALGLMTLIMIAIVAVATISITNSSFAKNQTLATRYSEATLEWVRNQKEESWNNFKLLSLSGLMEQTICFPELSWDSASVGECSDTENITDTLLKREIDFSIVDVEQTTIEVLVRIYWIDSKGYHEANSTTNLTNWN